MVKALVGYTGFVGSNIYESGEIDRVYNSKNIEAAYGTKPDILIYAGVSAEKYLANHEPEKDMENIRKAEENIRKITPKKLVLISTIDVFKKPVGVDETTDIDTNGLHPYGYNRYRLEEWARKEYSDALVVRLPALFGKNIKKNFIYDFINVIPSMLKDVTMEDLVTQYPEIKDFYELQNNGFYGVKILSEEEKKHLKELFKATGFTALDFTDSRSSYQFYPLLRLWGDIKVALKLDIRLWHAAVEPITAGEVYRHLTGKVFKNEISGNPARYDFRTVYDGVFFGDNGYILNRESVLKQIREFVK